MAWDPAPKWKGGSPDGMTSQDNNNNNNNNAFTCDHLMEGNKTQSTLGFELASSMYKQYRKQHNSATHNAIGGEICNIPRAIADKVADSVVEIM